MDIIKTNIAVFSLFQLFEKWNLLIATFKSTLTSALCHFYNYIFYFRIKKNTQEFNTYSSSKFLLGKYSLFNYLKKERV